MNTHHLTRPRSKYSPLFSKQQTHMPHPSLAAWEKRLGIKDKQWDVIASRCKSSFFTPRDYHLHFKHITHRRIATNNRFSDQSSICRFCHQYEETTMHLGRCPCLTAIFGTINKAVGFVPTQNMTVQQKKVLDIRFAHTLYPHQSDPNLTSRPQLSTLSKSPSPSLLMGGCVGGRCL
jgi:hypothetical protein